LKILRRGFFAIVRQGVPHQLFGRAGPTFYAEGTRYKPQIESGGSTIVGAALL
jgi:hypothetical protein